MKKLTFFILTIFTVATLFAAARPSLDGRAVVADMGTMPRGLFARTVGYLPGDSVTVTNPATGTTADVLVLGAIDPSEGVAILLSPEAAEALRIAPNSNVQVKLTKRSGSLDENASGSAVLSDGEEIAEAPVAEVEAPVSENAVAEENAPAVEENLESAAVEVAAAETETAPDPMSAVTVVQEDALTTSALKERETENVVEETVVPENTDESAVAEEAVVAEETVAVEEVPAEVQPVVEVIPAVETPVEEKAAETVVEEVVAQETPVAIAENTKPAENVAVEKQTLQPVILVQEEPQKVVETEILDPVEEELPALVEDDDTVVLQPVKIVETPAPEKETVVSEEAVAPEVGEEVVSKPVEVVAEETPVVAAVETVPEPLYAEKEPEVVVEEEAYSPITLVPADLNPPVAEEKLVEAVKVEEVSKPVEPEVVKIDPPLLPKEKETAPAPEKTVESVKPVVSNDWTNYVVPSHNNLVKGYYYIQIASLGNVDNIKNVIKKYGSKYPVVLIQSTNGKTYQVLVGPLNIDEYGSVLAKFKAYGYKDAFVKKIK